MLLNLAPHQQLYAQIKGVAILKWIGQVYQYCHESLCRYYLD
jgi:hypothetical protein